MSVQSVEDKAADIGLTIFCVVIIGLFIWIGIGNMLATQQVRTIYETLESRCEVHQVLDRDHLICVTLPATREVEK